MKKFFFLLLGIIGGGNMPTATVQAEDLLSDLILYQYELAYRSARPMEKPLGYNLYLAEALKFYDKPLDHQTVPLIRGSLLFAKDQNSCVYPSNLQAWKKGFPEREAQKIIVSKPIDRVSIYFYAKAGKKPPQSVADLRGRKIGHVHGNVGARILANEGLNFVSVRSEGQLLKMLENDRLDVIMSFHPDMPIAFDQVGEGMLSFDKSFSILNAEVSFLCHDTEAGRDFIMRMNQAIIALNYSGKAQELLGPHAEIVPLKEILGAQ